MDDEIDDLRWDVVNYEYGSPYLEKLNGVIVRFLTTAPAFEFTEPMRELLEEYTGGFTHPPCV